ncbi:MAG TPA: rhomboid family intramembrane serine protease [Acidimicrobiales bacterium]|nr:rhomboid family intramembrane serine protease [Acidimicrobiales bacterium]
MLPIKDENPTSRPAVLTFLIGAACVAVFVLYQASPGANEVIDTPVGAVEVEASLAFTLERAAIPCEIRQGEPLSLQEITATFAGGDPDACGQEGGPLLFPDKSVWLAIVTSMFLHGGWLHLGGNMLFLWVFGNNVEDRLGVVRYLLVYLAAGVAATAAHVAASPDSTIPIVGASGAIAGVMGAYLVWFPNAPVRTLFVFFLIFVTDVRAKWLLGAWFGLQFFTGNDSGVAWVAHVGGFVFGVVVGLVVRASATARRAVWRTQAPPGPWDDTGGAGRGPYGDGWHRRF